MLIQLVDNTILGGIANILEDKKIINNKEFKDMPENNRMKFHRHT